MFLTECLLGWPPPNHMCPLTRQCLCLFISSFALEETWLKLGAAQNVLRPEALDCQAALRGVLPPSLPP